MTDVFEVQDEIAGAVVEQLKLKLIGAPPRAQTTDPEAFALFMQARQFVRQGTDEGLERASAVYQQALAIDPGYAAAWNNLGLLQHRMGHYERAGSCYGAALEADPACAQAAFNLGALSEDLGDLPVAITWYRRALELDADYADAHFNLAGVLGKAGRPDEAGRHWQRYLELDAESPWAQIARSHLGAAVPDAEDEP